MIGRVIRGFQRCPTKQGRRSQRGWHISKRGPRSFGKGRGARSLGNVDSKGHFKYTPRKLPLIVVPDLTDFELKPYVAYGTPKLESVSVPKVKDLDLDLSKSEIHILDIISPQHNKQRPAKYERAGKEMHDYLMQTKYKHQPQETSPAQQSSQPQPQPPSRPTQSGKVDIKVEFQ